MRWTNEKDNELIRLWRDNYMSQGQLAQHFGTTRNAVAGRLMRLRARPGSNIPRRQSMPKSVLHKPELRAKPPRITPSAPSTKEADEEIETEPGPYTTYKPVHYKPFHRDEGPKKTRRELLKELEEAMLNTARMQVIE